MKTMKQQITGILQGATGPMASSELYERLDYHPEDISRALGELYKDGLVTYQGTFIVWSGSREITAYRHGGFRSPTKVSKPTLTIIIQIGEDNEGYWYRLTQTPTIWNTGEATGAGKETHVGPSILGVVRAILEKLFSGERG